MIKYKKLNELFPAWLAGGGIFSALQNFSVPWKAENVSQQLDMIYHGGLSGEKLISPFLNKVCLGSFLTEDEKNAVCTAIIAVCGQNWGKQWQTLSFSYNPIENYSMTEKMSDDKTVSEYGKTQTRTDDLTHTKRGTETDAPNLTETQTPNLQNTTNNSVYGFNSTEGVSTENQEQKATGTSTTAQTGTETRTYDTTDADSGTQAITDGGSDSQTRNYELTRSGNVGVTTSQQMIESERALWTWNFFYNVVFPDLNSILTLKIY